MRTPISRRTALRSFAGAAALATLTRSVGAEKKRKRGAAAPDAGAETAVVTGEVSHSVCKWCYPKIPLEDLAKSAKDIGLSSIELLQPSDFPTLKKYDLACAMVSNPTAKTPQGVTVGAIGKAWNRLEHHDTLVEAYTKQIAEVANAGFEKVICFSGNRDGMADEQGMENCAIGLKRIMDVAEKNKVTVCMELLNSKVNHKDYMCDHTAWGVALAKKIGSERFKLLYDIYHMQIMEGDVIATIKANHAYLAHYHTGGVPGRHEIDGTQELNYPAIVQAIRATGYRGYLGQEFLPAHDPLTSLRAAVKLCTV